jgi:hypothetical protein
MPNDGIWKRLSRGLKLEGLPKRNGRAFVGGLRLPSLRQGRTLHTRVGDFEMLESVQNATSSTAIDIETRAGALLWKRSLN